MKIPAKNTIEDTIGISDYKFGLYPYTFHSRLDCLVETVERLLLKANKAGLDGRQIGRVRLKVEDQRLQDFLKIIETEDRDEFMKGGLTFEFESIHDSELEVK